MKWFSFVAFLALGAGAFADPCIPTVAKFQVFDAVLDTPVEDSFIDSENALVCLPESGVVSIEAITSCVEDSVFLKVVYPNGFTFTKREGNVPYTLFGNQGPDYFGRANFVTGKSYTISAGFDPTAGDVSYSFQFKECDSDPFNIQLQLVGVPEADKSFFIVAQSRWESVITTGLVEFSTASGFGLPYLSGCTYPAVVDDVYMCAKYDYIDGPGKVLGYAGPEWYNSVTGLPITGYMVIETVDAVLSNDKMARIAMHEMGKLLQRSIAC